MGMNKPYRVMVDPGHGGNLPGAVNKKLGIKEKDITLSVALIMMRHVYSGDYLFEPHITRKGDRHVSLQGRCDLAKLYNCDAFMSIHTNARHRKGKYGLEIEAYHYDSSLKGYHYANIVLGLLLNRLKYETEVINRGVKKGNYYVLRHTIMPAILVELGFLSDDEEAVFLSKKENKLMMAIELAEGTELFLEGGGV